MFITAKKCSRCQEKKDRTEFGRNQARPDGLSLWCRQCNREYQRERYGVTPGVRRAFYRRVGQEPQHKRAREKGLLRRYGITSEQYGALLAHQGGGCAGCGVTAHSDGMALAVDHDHGCCPPDDTGREVRTCGRCTRGIICPRCNKLDVLAGRPHVDWTAVMRTLGEDATTS